MLPLFERVWNRYGNDQQIAVIIDRRGNIWGASRHGAITQYISRRPPSDPGDERVVLPPWIVQLRRVTSVFIDGDGFLNVIGAFLCIICGVLCSRQRAGLGAVGGADAGSCAGGLSGHRRLPNGDLLRALGLYFLH